MRKFIVLILIASFIAINYGLDVKSCSTSLKAPTNVEIIGCTKAPCKIKRGSNLSAEILFATSEATSTLKTKLFAKVLGLKMPINLPAEHQDVCAHLKEGKCPLAANQNVLYSATVPIPKNSPAMKTEIEVNLIGDNQKSHICFRIDGQIV